MRETRALVTANVEDSMFLVWLSCDFLGWFSAADGLVPPMAAVSSSCKLADIFFLGSGYFAGPGKIAPRRYFAGPGKIVPRGYFAGPGKIAILDL